MNIMQTRLQQFVDFDTNQLTTKAFWKRHPFLMHCLIMMMLFVLTNCIAQSNQWQVVKWLSPLIFIGYLNALDKLIKTPVSEKTKAFKGNR